MDTQVQVFSTELALLEAFIDAVVSLDPDIVVGYDLQKESLGYVVDRAGQYGLPLLRRVSRTPEVASIKERMDDEWGRQHASGLHCTGERTGGVCGWVGGWVGVCVGVSRPPGGARRKGGACCSAPNHGRVGLRLVAPPPSIALFTR